MMDSLTWIAMFVAFAVIAYVGVPRLVGVWYTRSAWSLSGADLASKFHGLIVFGLDGSFLALSPKSRRDTVSFTKFTTEEGANAFKIRIESDRLTPECVIAIQTRLDIQPSHIQWSHAETVNPQLLEIEIGGPVTLDSSGMEGVARGVLGSLGYESSQKYRIDYEGPNDEEKIAEYLSS